MSDTSTLTAGRLGPEDTVDIAHTAIGDWHDHAGRSGLPASGLAAEDWFCGAGARDGQTLAAALQEALRGADSADRPCVEEFDRLVAEEDTRLADQRPKREPEQQTLL